MKKNTIIFLNIYPLEKPIAAAFDLPLLERSGYRLVYLDMSSMYYPNTFDKCMPANKEYFVKKDYFIECQTKEDVLKWIKQYAGRAWFCPLHSRFNERMDKMWLKRAFKKYKCDYVVQAFWSLPSPLSKSTGSVNLRRHFITNGFRGFGRLEIRDIFNKALGWCSFFLMARNVYYKSPRCCFVTGKSLFEWFKKLYPKSEIISIPSYEYFRYYRVVSNADNGRIPQIPKYGYLLYLDQSIFDSPDGKLLGIPVNDKNVFLENINRFFDRLENVTDKRVVIAASPKSRYDGHEYNGREIIYDLTPELTYYSDLVIMHNTTAHCLAIAMHKPIVILTMKSFNRFAIEAIQFMADALRKKVIDASEDFDLEKIHELSKVDQEFYNNYINNYMATEPFVASPAEVMLETLKAHDGYVS